jgi:general secretion pathway protein G
LVNVGEDVHGVCSYSVYASRLGVVRRKEMMNRLRENRDEHGYTLIELLIVVIVLAILAAIVVFALGSTRADALHSECATSEKSVEWAAEAIHTRIGAYPQGTFVAASNPNPLLVPSAGALLKSYPTSPDYSLTYVGDSDAQGNTTYVVNVLNKGGAQVGTGSTGCSAL